MSDPQNSSVDRPKANKSFDYIASGLIFFAAAICGAVTKKNAFNNNESSASHEIADWTRVVALWTRALVIVGLITSVVLLLQYCALQTADQTTRSTNRAFVYFENIGLTPYPQQNPVTVTVITLAINSGNTPAHDVSFKFDCPDKAAIGNRDPFESARLNPIFDPPTFLGPKQTIPLIVCQLPPTYADAILSSANSWYVAAQITYADVFEPTKMHVTQMTRNVRADQFGGRSFGYVGKHNCADENCPSYRQGKSR